VFRLCHFTTFTRRRLILLLGIKLTASLGKLSPTLSPIERAVEPLALALGANALLEDATARRATMLEIFIVLVSLLR
jgi:hypothetical protein